MSLGILIKLPVKPLVHFTAVSKTWQSLIRSFIFINYHLKYHNHRSQKPLLLLGHDDNPHVGKGQFTVLDVDKNGSFSTYYSSELPTQPRYGHVGIMGSYNGIICLLNTALVGCNYINSVVLWNPSVGKHIILPDGIVNPEKISLGVWGVHHDYKVLRLVHLEGMDINMLSTAEIYSLRVGRWRKLSGFFHGRLEIFSSKHAYLNGVVHWIAKKSATHRTILGFNVDHEVFDEATLTLPDELANKYASVLEVYLIEESLGVIYLNFDSSDVWLMKDYGVKESWTRLYSIEMRDNKIYRVLGGFHNNDEAVIAIKYRCGAIVKDYGYYLYELVKFVEVNGEMVYAMAPIQITFADYYRESLLLF